MIYLASDHAGLRLKNVIRRHLLAGGLDVTDIGPHSYDSGDDYPDYVLAAAQEVARDPAYRGFVFCGSGQGSAIAANKVTGVRAGLYDGGPLYNVRLLRQHNDANVLSIAARRVDGKTAIKAVRIFLKTSFDGGRHARRVEKICRYENGVFTRILPPSS